MKKIILAFIMMCANHAYSMENEKPYPGSDCLFGRYSVWEVEANANKDSDKQNVVPYVLLNPLLTESDLERMFFGFLLMLIRAITQ